MAKAQGSLVVKIDGEWVDLSHKVKPKFKKSKKDELKASQAKEAEEE